MVEQTPGLIRGLPPTSPASVVSRTVLRRGEDAFPFYLLGMKSHLLCRRVKTVSQWCINACVHTYRHADPHTGHRKGFNNAPVLR